MRTTVELPDELYFRLKERAIEEKLSLKLLVEKSSLEYLANPTRSLSTEQIELPVASDGTGKVLVDPSSWWAELNERS